MGTGNRSSAVRSKQHSNYDMSQTLLNFGVQPRRVDGLINHQLENDELLITAPSRNLYFENIPTSTLVNEDPVQYRFRKIPDFSWDIQPALDSCKNERAKQLLVDNWNAIERRANMKFSDNRSRVFRVFFPGGPRSGQRYVELRKNKPTKVGELVWGRREPEIDANFDGDQFKCWHFPTDANRIEQAKQYANSLESTLKNMDVYRIVSTFYYQEQIQDTCNQALGEVFCIDNNDIRNELARGFNRINKQVSQKPNAEANMGLVEKLQDRIDEIYYGSVPYKEMIGNKLRMAEQMAYHGTEGYTFPSGDARSNLIKDSKETLRIIERMPNSGELKRKINKWAKYLESGGEIKSQKHLELLQDIFDDMF
jgi:hypothetical protein